MRIPTFMALCLLFTSQGIVAKTYIWYDDTGQAVFSDVPPTDNRQTQIATPPPPPAESPAEARKRLDQRLEKFMDTREDRQLTTQKQEKEQASAKRKQTSCDIARRNLTKLQQKPNALAVDSKGQYHRYTIEQRAEKIQQQMKTIELNCR